MDLLDSSEVGRIGPVRAQPGTEAVLQPRKLLEHVGPVDVSAVEMKQLLRYHCC